MSILQFLRIFWARRFIVLAATVSCVLGAFVVTQIVPPRYQAQSRVMLDLVKPDPVTGETISTSFARAYTSTQIELIKDYRVAGAVVDDLGWTNDANLITQYQNRSSGDERDLRRYLAQRVIDGTRAKLLEGSNILEISFTSNTPEGARVVADALREAYISSSLDARRQAARRTADWYATQAEKAKQALADAETVKATYERENGLVLQDDKTDIDSARLAALAQAANAPMIAPVIAGPSPTSLQLGQLDGAIAQASRTLGPNHPDLIAMRQQRQALAVQVAAERSAGSSAAGAAASAAKVGLGMLEAQKSKVIGQRDELEHLRGLQSEVDLRRDQFLKAASRVAELRLEAEVGETGISALGNAVTPQKAIFPNIPLIMVGALGFGVGFGLLIALLCELSARRVRGAEDLSAAANAPLLAVFAAPPTAKPPAKEGRAAQGTAPFGRRKLAKA